MEWDNREEPTSLQEHAEEVHPGLDKFTRLLRVVFYRTCVMQGIERTRQLAAR